MIRSGCWRNTAQAYRSACRSGYLPDDRYNFVGFRHVLVPITRQQQNKMNKEQIKEAMLVHLPDEMSARAIADFRGQGFSTFGPLDMVWCPPGTFIMGSPPEEPGRFADEDQIEVELTRGFWIARTQLTQKVWQELMGNNPSNFKGDDRPVESVSWNDCQDFLRVLNDCYPVKDFAFRLPTEAQWEYACRAGTTTAFSCGDDPAQLGDYAWFSENGNWETHPVAQKLPNPWGLFDMHGNVWEWCQDFYGDYKDAVEEE